MTVTRTRPSVAETMTVTAPVRLTVTAAETP